MLMLRGRKMGFFNRIFHGSWDSTLETYDGPGEYKSRTMDEIIEEGEWES